MSRRWSEIRYTMSNELFIISGLCHHCPPLWSFPVWVWIFFRHYSAQQSRMQQIGIVIQQPAAVSSISAGGGRGGVQHGFLSIDLCRRSRRTRCSGDWTLHEKKTVFCWSISAEGGYDIPVVLPNSRDWSTGLFGCFEDCCTCNVNMNWIIITLRKFVCH